MQEGCIVYLIGGQEVPEANDLKANCRELGLQADQVALVGAKQGFFEVEEAWHYLLTQGCGRVNLLVVQCAEGKLAAVHPPVRLYG